MPFSREQNRESREAQPTENREGHRAPDTGQRVPPAPAGQCVDQVHRQGDGCHRCRIVGLLEEDERHRGACHGEGAAPAAITRRVPNRRNARPAPGAPSPIATYITEVPRKTEGRELPNSRRYRRRNHGQDADHAPAGNLGQREDKQDTEMTLHPSARRSERVRSSAGRHVPILSFGSGASLIHPLDECAQRGLQLHHVADDARPVSSGSPRGRWRRWRPLRN